MNIDFLTSHLIVFMCCSWRLYLARCYARAWSSSCSQPVALTATRLFLYVVRNVHSWQIWYRYNYTTVYPTRYRAECPYGWYNLSLKSGREILRLSGRKAFIFTLTGQSNATTDWNGAERGLLFLAMGSGVLPR